MVIDGLEQQTSLIKNILKEKNISKLTDVQKKAFRYLDSERNLVIVAPSGAGKTLIAEIITLKEFLQKKKTNSPHNNAPFITPIPAEIFEDEIQEAKTVFLVPLRALADEKANDFARNYRGYKLRVHLSMSEVDFNEEEILKCNILISTYERFKIILGRIPNLPNFTRNVIVDEFHLLGDKSRGPILEFVLTSLLNKVRLILLSATIANPQEVANWLQGILIISTKRLIPLDYNIKTTILPEQEIRQIIKQNIYFNVQTLIFCGTRNKAETFAQEFANFVYTQSNLVDGINSKEIEENLIKNNLSRDTVGNNLLYELAVKGAACHHAGLSNMAKKAIEDLYRRNKIKVLFCTETLGAGVNLPAREVVLIDTKRWNNEWLSRNVFHQIAGRAGRPDFDKYGKCTILAIDSRERKAIYERYWKGKILEKEYPSKHTENLAFDIIESKLNNKEEFEKLLISLIKGNKPTTDDLIELLRKSFFNFKQIQHKENYTNESFFELLLSTKTIFDENSLLALEKYYPVSNIELIAISDFEDFQNIELMDEKIKIIVKLAKKKFLCSCNYDALFCKHKLFVLKLFPFDETNRILNDEFSFLDKLIVGGYVDEMVDGRLQATSKGTIWAEMGITKKKFDLLKDWLMYDLFPKKPTLKILLNECLKVQPKMDVEGLFIDNLDFRKPIFEHIILRREMIVVSKYQLYEGDLLRVEVGLKTLITGLIPLAEFLELNAIKTKLEELNLLLTDAMF